MPIDVINLATAQRTSANSNEGTAAGRAQTANNQSNSVENETEKTPYSDTVTLTDTATQLHAIASEISEIPIVNMARVEEMQSRISSGEFEIDSNNLANNILRLETQL